MNVNRILLPDSNHFITLIKSFCPSISSFTLNLWWNQKFRESYLLLYSHEILFKYSSFALESGFDKLIINVPFDLSVTRPKCSIINCYNSITQVNISHMISTVIWVTQISHKCQLILSLCHIPTHRGSKSANWHIIFSSASLADDRSMASLGSNSIHTKKVTCFSFIYW